MQKVGSVVEFTSLFFVAIVDTHTVVFVVTMQLAGLKIDISPSSYVVVHQTFTNEEIRWWEHQYATVF